MFQDITVEELLELQENKELVLVDVRSPEEYEDFTIPGSLNIPLFDDEERKEIGTLYKQVSVQAAKEKGLDIVSRKLPQFIKTFEQTPGLKAVYCWRGGMRSKATATVLSLMGIRVYRVSGGIRNYRKWVHQTLEQFDFKPNCLVVNGYTGSGKTKILQILADEGYPVLDLEGMAGHRGSIFGQIGLKPNNQKTFEALLVHELLRCNDERYVLLEAESKRIGKVTMPDFLMDAKAKGMQFFLEMPVPVRVRHIIEEYEPHRHKKECLASYDYIKKRLHTPIAAEIEEHLLADRFSEAVTLLLEHYYDTRYEYAARQYGSERIVLRVTSIEQAVEAIKKKLSEF